MIEEDNHMLGIVRKAIKENIWPTTKFTKMAILNDIELMEEGNFLNEILNSLNFLSFGKIKRSIFCNRYGKKIVEVLSSKKFNATEVMKKNIAHLKLSVFLSLNT